MSRCLRFVTGLWAATVLACGGMPTIGPSPAHAQEARSDAVQPETGVAAPEGRATAIRVADAEEVASAHNARQAALYFILRDTFRV